MAQQYSVAYDSYFVKPLRPAAPRTTRPRYDFGGANPGPDVLPIAELAEAARAAVLEQGHLLSQYPPLYGSPALRELIVDKMLKDRGLDWATTEDVMVTNGSMHGITLVLETMIKPGDVVVADRFFYQGAVTRFAAAGARTETVEGDDDGMRMDALEEVLSSLLQQGKRPKFIYTIPSPQNPDGSIMPVERRRRMLALAAEYDTLIFEDDCYVDQTLDIEAMPPAIAALEGGQERVIYIATFSKIIGPGIRVGWATATPPLLQQLAAYKQDGGKDYLSSMVVTKFLQDHMSDRIPELNALLRRKRDTVIAALRENFGPQIEMKVPVAGNYTWVRFPEGMDMTALAAKSLERGVSFIAGPRFSPTGDGTNYARFNHCAPPVDEIAEGIGIFAQVVREEGAMPG